MAPIFNFTRALLFLFVLLIFSRQAGAFGHPVNFSKYRQARPSQWKSLLNNDPHLTNTPGVVSISYYIKENATGNNNGSSWQNAFTNLTTALLFCTKGDTIRIAKGTYKPAGSSFSLKDSVVILGGYANTGNPTDAERDFGRHPTILSGEAGNPLFPFDNLPTIITGNLVNKGTVLDGFIIEKGYSNNTIQGVGINLWRSSPEIRNCVFRNNSSYNSSLGGSSISCQNNSNPIIINCFFVNNLDFGFSTIFIKSNCKARLINCVFSGNDGRFVVYANQSNLSITNCTFINNQIGNSVLPRDARAGYVFGENSSVLTVSNTIFFKNKFKLSIDTADISLNAASLTILNSITQNYPTGNNYLLGIDPKLKDISNIAGPDNFFFTPDDGLMLERCSPAINAGNNVADAAIFNDILQQARIFNGNADIGAYEYQAGNGDEVLSNANDSLVANREYTDQNGWTNYYMDCQLLMSVKKNGQQIGSINDGTFKVVVNTTAGYGSSAGTNLSQAAYVTPGVYWSALNRFWTIRATKQPLDSLLVRFPWSVIDFNDAKGINPELNTQQQLVFYTVDSPFVPLSINATNIDFHPYYQLGATTTQSWNYSAIDTINYAMFYVKKLNSGGMGTGTGINNGPTALPNNDCQGSDKIFAATLMGSAYQWQVNKGSGFFNIMDDAAYKGTSTNLLRIIAPPTNNYGQIFRCMVTTTNDTLFTPEITLKFESQWIGTTSTSWNEAANWSCGVVPDSNTAVVIKGGTPFNPMVNADLSCRSVRLIENAVVTVAYGNKLLITGAQ